MLISFGELFKLRIADEKNLFIFENSPYF